MGAPIPSVLRNVPSALRNIPASSRAVPSSTRAVPAVGSGPPSTGLALRMETDFGITSAASLATGWTDQSSNANSASASGAGRPTVVASANNGLPGLQFDGAATFMTGASNVVASGTDRTIYVVLKGTGAADSSGVYFDFRQAATDMYLAMGIAAVPYVSGDGVAINSTISAGGWTSNAYQLNHITRTSNTAALFINGTSRAITGGAGFASDTGTAGYLIGARAGGTIQFFTGIIQAILVYSIIQTAGDLTATKSYLGLKYGLTVA